MAIMQRCCCFNNVRSGSIASGIYTLVYAAIVLVYAAYEIGTVVSSGILRFHRTSPLFIIYCFYVALVSFVLIFSILLLVGVSRDQRGLLLPYMVVMPLLILTHGVNCILYIVAIAQTDYRPYDNTTSELSGALVIMASLTVLDIFCFLCVVSQYQELCDGRGRLQDVIAARTRTTVITSSAPAGAAVVVTQQGYPNPQQGYPNPQQGYPNPQQGFTNPMHGYPNLPPAGYPQPEGYPPQPEGYPPQPEGYPPQPGYPYQPEAYPQKI